MEAYRQAREQYIHSHTLGNLTGNFSYQEVPKLQFSIRIAIKEISSTGELFKFVRTIENLKKALNASQSESDVMSIGIAFQSLEDYFLLLLKQPWKPEFRKLKTYGGFFRTKVKSFIPNPEMIFSEVGYLEGKENHVLVHKGNMDLQMLMILAFDCKVASMLCDIIAADYSKAKSAGMSLKDSVSKYIHESWTRGKANTPPRPVIATHNITQGLNGANRGKGLTYISDGSLSRAHVATSEWPPNTGTSNFNPLTYDREIIPELPQGTCDEHIQESFRLMGRQGAVSKSEPSSYNLYYQKSPLGASDMDRFQDLSHPSSTATYPPGSQKMDPLVDLDKVLRIRCVHSYGSYGSSGVRPSDNVEDASNPYSNATFPPGHPKVASRMSTPIGASYDEGIEHDFGPNSNSNKFSYSQNPLSATEKHPSNMSQQDHGYATRTGSGMAYNFPSSNVPSPQMIYQPVMNPNTEHLMARKSMPHNPPQVPSRALKPVFNPNCPRNDDYLDGDLTMSAQTGSMPNNYNKIGAVPETVPSTSNGIGQGQFLVPQASTMDPVLRLNGNLVAKRSHSLKMTPVNQEKLVSRTSKSMDCKDLKWECPTCRTANLSLHCKACASKMCPTCTYVNDKIAERCKMCETPFRE